MSKITKNERISTLEDAVAMNWSDMKKIETKISRAMTDMATRISNISLQLEGQQRQIHLAADSIGLNKQAIIMLENKAEPEPQLKQLDQSVFDGLDEKWRFAAVDADGSANVFDVHVYPRGGDKYGLFAYADDHANSDDNSIRLGEGYDASNWQNSLIEREMKELTGSALAKDYFKRGHCPRVCFVGEDNDECLSDLMVALVIGYVEGKGFETSYNEFFPCAAMVNSYGDELEASEVGS